MTEEMGCREVLRIRQASLDRSVGLGVVKIKITERQDLGVGILGSGSDPPLEGPHLKVR